MEITQGSKFRVFDSKEQVQMGLNLESAHTLMSMLRNNIYSDPLTSFVREVFSNAVDANVRAGRQHKGIDVYIEREDTHGNYIVRDYGDSMDKEKIQTVYAILGKSDKTNDNTEIGGWGIGAASPLAYTDHFFIETWTQEGDQKIYRKWVQYIDPSRIGAIGLQEEHDAYPDDKLGTKVTVPFKLSDYDRVVKALSMYLFYTKANYNLHGTELKYSSPKYNQIGKGWAMLMTNEDYNKWDKPSNKGMALVGDIPYRLNVAVLMESLTDFPIQNVCKPKTKREASNFYYFDFFMRSLPYYEWEISVPIGSVDLSAAREDLQYTPKTIYTLLAQLYVMYNEYMEALMIELTENTSLLDACARYCKFYGGHIKHEFLSKLRWRKENLSFDGRKDLATKNGLEIYKYHLDKVYGQTTKDILRKDMTSMLNPGHIVKAVLIKQDTEYRNYSKFLKFYMQREDDQYNLRAIVVKEDEWQHLRPWALDSFKQLNMSRLVEYYRECNPTMVRGKGKKSNLAQKVEFRCFSYANEIRRDRADGFGCLFVEGVADINPDTEHYYISEEEVAQTGLDFPVNQSDMLRFLRVYLKTKGIPYSNVYYTKKTTRNFNDDNWISLMDLMMTDKKVYDRSEVEFMKQSYTYFLCQSQYLSLTDYKIKHLTNKRGRYAEALLTYALAQTYHTKQVKNGRHNFACFTDSSYRSMVNKANSRYNVFKLDELNWISKNNDVMMAINDVTVYIERLYLDYPMLKYVNAHYSDMCGVGKYEFLEYIGVLEKHRGEARIEKEALVKSTSGSYTMTDLINHFLL